MWLLSFLVLPVAFAVIRESTMVSYRIRIENGTLTSVRATNRSLTELNLSSLGLRRIEPGAFKALVDVKILNLANNSLVDLPEFVFSNLTNLEHLSLADNSIASSRNAFVGLGHLRTLNISNNPVRFLESSEFYGLSTAVNIFTLGGTLEKISADLFEGSPKSFQRQRRATVDVEYRPGDFPESQFRVKACIDNGKLKLVDLLNDNETLASHCTEIRSENNDRVYIENLNITSFERGWYRIAGKRIWLISLSNNEIVRFTSEMLNELPESVWHVQLDGNKLERFERGIIENYSIRRLWVNKNSIREIEDGAFEKTNLEDLNLDDNLLTNMKFVDSLPPSFGAITIQRNRLTEIANDTFLKHSRLEWLAFDGNQITELYKDSLSGIPYLNTLGLSDNRITRIEPGCFRNFRSLRNVNLRNNSIGNLENGTFNGVDGIDFLDLGMNKFTSVTEQIRGKLPSKLRKLSLDFNEIRSLESGDFPDSSINELNLRDNNITRVAEGSLMMRSLLSLDLGNNSLSAVDGELFKSFDNIHEIRLDGNGITKIEKGFAKHLFFVSTLDISRNPIKKLENGALHGIRKNSNSFILTSQTPIEIIQGGLFEDV